MQDYKVNLETYSGPMDLLLYLIRRDEVDIYDIPISRVLEQYLQYVRMLEVVDPDVAGDFLVLAASLMEIKSRMLLPRPPVEEGGEELLDPRADLVRQLLAYRSFRTAAGQLQDRADAHAQRLGRPMIELPGEEGHVDIEDVQVWDLLAAFNKLMSSIGSQKVTHDVVYDDTPITLHATDIQDRLQREGPTLPFTVIFEGRTRGEMIGLFLALLELIRQKRLRIDQPEPMGEIMLHLMDATPLTELTEAAEPATVQDDAEEPDEYADVVEPIEPLMAEEVFEEELDEQEDDFSRRIGQIQIDEVDLGRSMERTVEDPSAEEEVSPPQEEEPQ